MADDSINLQRQQKELEILKTTEQFSKKFKNVVANLQEVNTPLAKTIADLRETTKGSFKAAANAKELQQFTDKVVKATSDNADKTTKSYQKLAQGLDKLSGTSGFLDQLKLAQDNFSLNQAKAIQLEQEIANAEFNNRKKIQEYKDTVAKLELDRIRAEGLGQEENLKKITAEKEKQEKALTKFETEIFDTKREELEIQKNLLETSKSNLEKLNETVDKQAKEIADQDTRFTMFGQGLKELTGFDLLGTLDTVVDKVDAVGKIFGNKDLSGTIASAFSFGGNDDIVASIAGESQEVDPQLKIAKKELKETESIADESKKTNKLLALMLAQGTSEDKLTDKSRGFIPIFFGGLLNLLKGVLGFILPGGALMKLNKFLPKFLKFDKGLEKTKAFQGVKNNTPKTSMFGNLGDKVKGLAPKTKFGKGALLTSLLGGGLFFANRSSAEDSTGGMEDSELMGSEASALTRGLDTYQNSKVSDTFRPDELASESYDTLSLRGSMGDFFKDFDADDPRKVDKLYNKDGSLDKRTKFYKEWKAHNLKIRDAMGGATDKYAQADYEKSMKITPQELDDMIDGYKNDPVVRKMEAAKIFDKNFARSAGAKLPMIGSGLDVFFDQREQKKYGMGIDMLTNQGLLSGDDLKTVQNAEYANNRGSFGRGIGSWAGGLAGAALPALGAVALSSNPVGWGVMGIGMITGLLGAMGGGFVGDKIGTFDSGAQELTRTLSEINSMDIDMSKKEEMVKLALKKYKGAFPNKSTEEILRTALNQNRQMSSDKLVGDTSVAANTVIDNRSSISNFTRPSFRNLDDTARLVDVKYS